MQRHIGRDAGQQQWRNVASVRQFLQQQTLQAI
jgi:hypothetical protein